MNGVLYFLPSFFLFSGEIAYSNKRPEHHDLIKRKDPASSHSTKHPRRAGLFFSCLFPVASLFIVLERKNGDELNSFRA